MLSEETRINRVAIVDQLLRNGLTCRQVAAASRISVNSVYLIKRSLHEVDREQAALAD